MSMSSKYVDIAAIIQIIGAIYNQPSLLDMEDKYHFNEEDFTEEFHQVLFSAIYNLHALGAKEINVSSIEDYLEQRPKKLAVYKANKGQEYLEKIRVNTQIAAFDYYYSRMKKMTLLRMYQSIGMDLSWLYDVDNIFDQKKKQAQEDWLDNTSIEEIAETIDKRVDDIKLKYVDNAENGSIEAGDGALELLESLKKTPEVGYPLYGPIINTITRGARLKKLYLRSSATGIGKALPNSTAIPTPAGERRVDEIKIGDYLFDAFGKPTLVQGVYPQGKKEVWEITFKDGRKAKCCEEHLWSYCTKGQGLKSKQERTFYTSTLKELLNKELYKKGSGYQILVPMQQAVEYPKKDFYIKPYSFGLMLGDGSFRYDKNQKALSYSSENEILPNEIAKEMNWDVKKNSEFNYSWTFEWKKEEKKEHKNVWVEEALKDYPALWNVKSKNKFIPKEYLESSIEQRFDLLNGLLDSDGSIDPIKGKISFYTISPFLKDNVIQLSRSLGFKTSVLEDPHKDTSLCYKIEINGTPENKIKLFKLPRKKQIVVNWYNNGKRKEHNEFNPIVSIKKLNYSEEMTCFYVDNKEHLFLMNDYIVTHNTRSMIADVCWIGCNKIFNINSGEWEDNGTREPVLFITTEQEVEEIQTMMLAFVANVDEEHIINGEYSDGEWDRVVYAANLLKKCPIYIRELPDFSLQDIENTIKFEIREHNVKYVFHDYIHSSMKILSEISSKTGVKGLREDNILFMIAIRLKDICNEYGVFILTSTQLNADYRTAQQYDQNLLRGAKAIADKIDCGLIMLETSQEDLKALEEVIQQGGYDIPTIKIAVYKNRRGRYKNILLWCRSDRSTCRIEPMFVTNYQYELQEIEDLKIKIKPRMEASAF